MHKKSRVMRFFVCYGFSKVNQNDDHLKTAAARDDQGKFKNMLMGIALFAKTFAKQ